MPDSEGSSLPLPGSSTTLSSGMYQKTSRCPNDSLEKDRMATFLRFAVCAVLVGIFPLKSSAETWVEFHAEKWDFKSQKLKKKLKFKNRSYYDADSLKRSASGDVDVWVKEDSMNDRYYVGKGVPSSEAITRKCIYGAEPGNTRYSLRMKIRTWRWGK